MLTAIQMHFRDFAEKQLVNWKQDDDVTAAIVDRAKPRQQRIRAVYDWLHFMRVIRFFGKELAWELASGVMDFYDDPSRPQTISADTDSVLLAFGQLENLLSEIAKLKGRSHGLVSLASKALWCCYPESVPIYDRNAEDALRVLGRLIDGLPQIRRTCEYREFLCAWFRLHEELKVIDSTPAHIRYKIRALDRYLWTLGQ